MTTDKIIRPDFGNQDVIFRASVDVKVLYTDDLVWLSRTTMLVNGVPEITHQLIEFDKEK